MSDDKEAVLCAFCGELIPAEVLQRRHHRQGRFTHCSKAHDMARRRANGDFIVMGRKGNAAQAKFKAKHGHIPWYKKRARATAKSNREKPRRAKKSG